MYDTSRYTASAKNVQRALREKMYAYSYNFQLGLYFIFMLVSFDRYNVRVNACTCNYSRYMAAAAEMCFFIQLLLLLLQLLP